MPKEYPAFVGLTGLLRFGFKIFVWTNKKFLFTLCSCVGFGNMLLDQIAMLIELQGEEK